MNKINTTGNWFFFQLICISLVLSWFFHKDATSFSDRNELWSDRAGYYIYLPATFFYHFDTRKMPSDLDVRTGAGFSIDTLHNKLETKYTYGLALLASPFFFASGLVSWIAGYDSENGFSMLYMRMMSMAAVVYLLLGLWFLKKFMDNYFQPIISYFVTAMVFLGTNLFYYALIDGMMSHVYSFFLFTLFLFTLRKYQLQPSRPRFLLLSLLLSVAILVRPTNIILGLLFFTWDSVRPAECFKRVKQFLKPADILGFLAILLVVFLPQLIYWKYLTGRWIHFSYGDEGFSNWFQPRIAEVLFSPVNGLLAFTPLVIIFLAGTGLMIYDDKSNGWPIAVVFVAVTLVCASWKMWYFGCSFGQRSYIEYYAILAVPFGYFTTRIMTLRWLPARVILMFFILFFVYFNLRYTISLYRVERCYFGSTWDWDHYFRSIERAGIISPVRQVRSYENDFENLALSPVFKPSKIFTRSGTYSIAASEKGGVTPLYSAWLDDFRYPYPKMMDAEIWVLKPGRRLTGASLCYTLNRGTTILFSDHQPLDSLVKNPLTWSRVSKTFIIPDVYDSSLQVRIFIRNPEQVRLYTDDLRLRFRYRWKNN